MKVVSNLVRYSRVDLNSALKRKNYGRYGINWIYFCDDCDSNCYRKNNIKLQKIMHQTNPLNHGGVDLNSALKRRNYGSIWNTGIRIWTNSVHSNTKTNKDLKRKRNSKRESQRRVMHQNFQLSN